MSNISVAVLGAGMVGVATALALQKKQPKHLGDCLVEMGLASEEDIVNVLEAQLKIPGYRTGTKTGTARLQAATGGGAENTHDGGCGQRRQHNGQ